MGESATPDSPGRPVTAAWPALRASFVRTAFPVPSDVWERLTAMTGSERA